MKKLDKANWRGRFQFSPDARGGDVSNRYVGLWVWGDGDNPSSAHTKLGKAYDSAFAVVDELVAFKKQTAEAGKLTLTELGVREAVAKQAAKDALPRLRQARATFERVKAEVEAKKASFKIKDPDPTDTLGEMRRAEMRAFLRAMPDEKRLAFVQQSKDRAVRDAIIHASSSELSGIPQSTHARLTDEAIREVHGEAMAEIEEMTEALATVERATKLGRDAIRQTIGVDHATFEKIASEAEQGSSVIPFRVDREVVDGKVTEVARVLDLDQRVWRRATASEIEQNAGAA